jgi:tRNA (guanine-N7-)-methyltransferase
MLSGVEPTPDLDPPPGPRGPGGVRTTRRRGRTSAAKEAALRDLAPRWGMPGDGPIDAARLLGAFGTSGPLLVDIGVGDGRATRAWGLARPEARVLALELHRPGLARLLEDLERDGPPNVRVLEADALEVCAQLEPASVAAVRVLFPDPWPKRRHVERRLVDRAFATRVADLLEPGGTLQLATDWADYAEHMRTMVATERRLEPVELAGRPDRPVTAYERRGIEAGRTIVDLCYRRVGPASAR